jgi:8-oxo-dGTP pyrophosphatase MutT (NUDIX family)
MKKHKIRPIAICVFRYGDRILVSQSIDPVKQEWFYRPLGGGIDFGEYSQEAIVREIREELGVEIQQVQLLGVLENVFVYDGKPGHEIVFVYDAELENQDWYHQSELTAHEGEESFKAYWVGLSDIETGCIPLYPTGLMELLTGDR